LAFILLKLKENSLRVRKGRALGRLRLWQT